MGANPESHQSNKEVFMEQFVGLDISQAMTHICVVDGKGKKLWQGKCPTEPEKIAKTLHEKSPAAALIGLESGALSPWLWHTLKDMGLPVVCVDARHAHGALSMQINKTDANDAHGIAQMMRTSFFKEVTVKSLDSHRIRTLLGARAQLVRPGVGCRETRKENQRSDQCRVCREGDQCG
jgi:transposase